MPINKKGNDGHIKRCQPDSHSRRLVRQVTLNGDVIRGNEYQEDGQSKLFTIQKSIRTETVVFVLWTSQAKIKIELAILFLFLMSEVSYLLYLFRGLLKYHLKYNFKDIYFF